MISFDTLCRKKTLLIYISRLQCYPCSSLSLKQMCATNRINKSLLPALSCCLHEIEGRSRYLLFINCLRTYSNNTVAMPPFIPEFTAAHRATTFLIAASASLIASKQAQILLLGLGQTNWLASLPPFIYRIHYLHLEHRFTYGLLQHRASVVQASRLHLLTKHLAGGGGYHYYDCTG